MLLLIESSNYRNKLKINIEEIKTVKLRVCSTMKD